MLDSGSQNTLEKELECLLAIIITHVSVKTVILFGSTACNSRNENSDIDVMVLVDSLDENAVNIAASIRQETFGKLSYPLDLIVESIQDYKARVSLPTLERKIAREGRVLYAA